jgi:hypothetical protein
VGIGVPVVADRGFLKLQIVPSGRADQVAGAVSRAGGKAKVRPRIRIRLREALFMGMRPVRAELEVEGASFFPALFSTRNIHDLMF